MEYQKICKNCQCYRQYCIKRRTRFQSLDFGHCTKLNKFPEQSHIDSCARFELTSETPKHQSESITKTLKKMAQEINDIAILLKNDME